MNKSVLVLGAGGHATVVVEMLRQLNYKIVGLVAQEQPVAQPVFDGIPSYLSDDDVLSFDKNTVLLVNAIGSLPGKILDLKCTISLNVWDMTLLH